MKIQRKRQQTGDYYVKGPDADEHKMSETRSMAVSYAIYLADRATRQGFESVYYVCELWNDEPLVRVASHPYPNEILVSIQGLETVA